MNPDPDLVRIPTLARTLSVSREIAENAVMELGLDPVGGVHRSFVEPIRQVIVGWIREGKI